VRLLQSLRMLGPRLLAAHCLYVDEEEKLMLAASHTSVVQCPSTYMLSGEPFHAAEILEAGGRVLLGTDAPCYSDGVDMLRETRNFVYALRLLTRRSTLLTAPQVLGLATVKATEALGLKRLGKIAMGAEADIVLLKPKLPRLRPVMEPHAAILYSATASDIDTVIIAGRVVVKGGRSTLVREEEVVEEGEKASRRLLKAALDLNPQLERVLPESAFKYL